MRWKVDRLKADAKSVADSHVHNAESDGDSLPRAEHLINKGIFQTVVIITISCKFHLKVKGNRVEKAWALTNI